MHDGLFDLDVWSTGVFMRDFDPRRSRGEYVVKATFNALRAVSWLAGGQERAATGSLGARASGPAFVGAATLSSDERTCRALGVSLDLGGQALAHHVRFELARLPSLEALAPERDALAACTTVPPAELEACVADVLPAADPSARPALEVLVGYFRCAPLESRPGRLPRSGGRCRRRSPARASSRACATA